mgnify:CR=1 FL=1
MLLLQLQLPELEPPQQLVVFLLVVIMVLIHILILIMPLQAHQPKLKLLLHLFKSALLKMPLQQLLLPFKYHFSLILISLGNHRFSQNLFLFYVTILALQVIFQFPRQPEVFIKQGNPRCFIQIVLRLS